MRNAISAFLPVIRLLEISGGNYAAVSELVFRGGTYTLHAGKSKVQYLAFQVKVTQVASENKNYFLGEQLPIRVHDSGENILSDSVHGSIK